MKPIIFLASFLGILALLVALQASDTSTPPAGATNNATDAAASVPTEPTQPNRFAVVGFWNKSDLVLTYQYRWGTVDWETATIRPQEQLATAWQFDREDQEWWPTPYVRYNAKPMGAPPEWRILELEAKAAPAAGYGYGTRYAFSLNHETGILEVTRVFDDAGPNRR